MLGDQRFVTLFQQLAQRGVIQVELATVALFGNSVFDLKFYKKTLRFFQILPNLLHVLRHGIALQERGRLLDVVVLGLGQQASLEVVPVDAVLGAGPDVLRGRCRNVSTALNRRSRVVAFVDSQLD